MYNLDDDYQDIDSFEAGMIPDDVREELDSLNEAKREARKEVIKQKRESGKSYKFSLRGI